ncbi:hypothetical protein LSTR_LSTR001101 [Laodelphax striatellus]|uniref:Mitochondrial thiamine pyrophosphate carrier n=1 Tax=Laodelphax striatellus TaxID=195883 RepID=A0A482X2G9_LAOST|nr:hypothetical protein LSTR_LSTR001101 [Laodelphax striatellus]
MNNDDQKKPSLIYAFAGAGSGVLTRALCQPFDVIKIRFQLQVEPITSTSAQSKYRGTLHCLTTIVQEEGVFGLWRGHLPAQLLSAVYGFVQFQTYEVLKQELASDRNKKEHKNHVNFLCGATSGCAATLFSFPFDIIRTRLVAQGNSKAYKGMIDGFFTIYRKDGMPGYFRGSSAALMVSGPLAGCQFLFYELFKNMALSVGLFNCFKGTIEGEKVFGLFKGLSPSLLKAALTTALHFAFYEEILHKLR